VLKSEVIEKRKLAFSSDIPERERFRYLCQTNFLVFSKFVFPQFSPAQVHKRITGHLQSVADGDEPKTTLSLPPRAGKSLLASQLFPAFILGRNPSSHSMIASYALKLSRENAMKTLQIMTSERYRFVFPELELKSNEIVETIRTRQGGVSRIFSAGSNCTGFSYGALSKDELPGVAIVDDLLASGGSQAVMNSTFLWCTEQFLTRRLPNNAIMLVGTRFHQNDVTGRLTKSDAGFKTLSIPALCIDEETDVLGRKLGESYWAETYDENFLAEMRSQVGENVFQTLYQSNPQALSTNVFKPNHIQYWEQLPVFKYRFLSLDTAFSTKESADYSVICAWGVGADNQLYLIDVVQKQADFPALLNMTREFARVHRAKLLVIEDKASGQSLIQVLKTEVGYQIKPVKPTKDKVTRANEIIPTLDKAVVWLPSSLNSALVDQMLNFPQTQHEDFVDSFVYGVKFYMDSGYMNQATKVNSYGLTPRLGGARRY